LNTGLGNYSMSQGKKIVELSIAIYLFSTCYNFFGDRCMDLDGDGYLSMYELEYFYEEQLHRMEAIGLETLPFEDCLCQVTYQNSGFVLSM